MTLSHAIRDAWKDVQQNRRAYLMACSACWGGMLFGWDTGLIGGILPRASFKHSFGLDVDSDTYASLTGWIVSVLQIGCFFGAMSTAYVSDRYGRKSALSVAAAIFICGSLLQVTPTIFTHSPAAALKQLNFGRAIGGFGVGMVSTLVPTYISESSPRHLRGRLTGMYQLFNVTGIAGSFWVNYALLSYYGEDKDKVIQWQIAFTLQIIPGVLLLYSMTTQDESPRWLAEKGRFEETRNVIASLRSLPFDDPVVKTELHAIRRDLEGKTKLSLRDQAKEACSSGKMFYRCSLPFLLMMFQQYTGVNAINYYSPVIFAELGVKGGSAALFGTGIYGIVKIVMTCISLAFGVEQWGRKAMLVWGGLGQAFCMLFIGIYKMSHTDSSANFFSYIAILALYLYVTFFSFGWSVAPWPAMSESVPNHLRSLTMSIGVMSLWFFNSIISKLTPLMLNGITYWTYILFAGTTLIGVTWALFFYPETGGYAIEDIHDLFDNVVAQSLHDNRYLFRSRTDRGGTGRRKSGEEVDAQRESMDSLRSEERLLHD